MYWIKLIYIWSVLLFTLNNGINAQNVKPYIEIPYLRNIPSIDGEISFNEWEDANSLSDFIVWTSDSYSDGQVKVFLGSDSINIYVCFLTSIKSRESFIRFLEPKKHLDSHLWGRHHVGIKLSNSKENVEFKGGPTLSRMDLKNGDISWDGNWEFNASINDSLWVAEFKIPISNLELERNIYQNSYNLVLETCNPGGSNTYWKGEIVLITKKPLIVNFKWSSPQPNKNSILVELTNLLPIKKEVRLELVVQPFQGDPEYLDQKGQGFNNDFKLEIQKKPIIFRYSHLLKPDSQKRISLDYWLPFEGNYYLSLQVNDSDGKKIYLSQGFIITLHCNSKRINAMYELMDDCRNLVGDSSKRFTSECIDLQKSLKDLKKRIKYFWNSQNWESLDTIINSFESKAYQMEHKIKWYKNFAFGFNSQFGVTSVNSVLKVRRDGRFEGAIKSDYSLYSARNEFESMQLVLLPFDEDLKNIEIKVEDFIDADGNKILKENIEISKVWYNNISWQPNYIIPYKGWYPDPLIPITDPFSINGRELCCPIWITIFVPGHAKPGKYNSRVIVSTSNIGSVELKIELNVWQFTLPDEPSLKTHTWDDLDLIKQFYNVQEFPVEWYLNFCDLLLKNKLNPSFASLNYIKRDSSGQYDFKVTEKILEHCLKKGMTKFSLCQMKKGDYALGRIKEDYDFIKDYAGFLKEKGWLNKAFVELWDEPTVLEWEQVKERASKIKSIDPDIKLQIFCSSGDPYKFWDSTVFNRYGLGDLIDVWIHLNLMQSPEFQKEGKEIWSYFATLARSNAPNFYIDSKGIYQRMIPWYCWLYGIDGFEHWSTTYFWRNSHQGEPMAEKWPDIEWDSRTFHDYHGEGQLVYPGKDGKFYPSIRLEIFRDGMDDYEYLTILKRLIIKNKYVFDYESISNSLKLLNFNGYLLDSNTENMCNTLENTLKYPDDMEKFMTHRISIGNQINELLKTK